MYDSDITRRQVLIFRFSVLLMFFTSMSKVLVPGAIFDQLQHELGLNAAVLGGLNAWYMIAYATSQVSLGIMADRIGGVRVLLIGGISFCLGMIIFPLCSNIWILRFARVLAGFGAGVVFLGSAKLIADLYPEKFTYILGIALVISYLGPVMGTAPMVWLVGAIGWRKALLAPSCCSVLAMAFIAVFSRGTLTKISSGESIMQPLIKIMCRADMIRLCIASSVVFGAYYALLTIMGRKCLEDVAGMPVKWAALIILSLTIIVATLNLLGGPIASAVKKHYGLALAVATLISIIGAGLGWSSLHLNFAGIATAVSYVLICIPAGLFPVYSTMGKDISPKQYVTLAVALVNFWAFVMISLVGYVSGVVMRSYEGQAEKVGDVLVYPASAYESVFIVFVLAALVGFACTIGIFRHTDSTSLKQE